MMKSSLWKSPALVIVCGCLIALITYGVRTSFGLFTEPLSEGRDWSREVFALSIAIQNLLWGVAQPAAGAFADRYGSARVLAAGGAVYAVGVGLALIAAALHWPIVERRAPLPTVPEPAR